MQKGFTLIEILITSAIIVIMALVAVPSFDKMGKVNNFQQKAMEIRDSLEQLHIMTLNPDKNASRYYFSLKSSSPLSLNFVKVIGDPKSPSESTVMKQIFSSPNITMQALSGNNPDSTTNKTFFYCDVINKNNCCQADSVSALAAGSCTAPPPSTYILKMTDTNLKKRALFKAYSDPHKIEIIYESL